MIFLKKMYAKAMHKKLSEIDSLYQKHAGEECYLFGGGVSLKWMDLRPFSDRPSILGNALIFHKHVQTLNVAYNSIIEPTYFFPFAPGRNGCGKKSIVSNPVGKYYRQMIKNNPETTFFINIANYPFARFPNALYVSRFYKSQHVANNPFMDRADAFMGTFRFQVAMAIYLGFKRAYLVGHDYTHYPSKSFHFFEKGTGVLNGHRKYFQDYIEYATRYMDMITVTLDASSETMKSITYEELTSVKPRYQENIDIVDWKTLVALSKRESCYSIF